MEPRRFAIRAAQAGLLLLLGTSIVRAHYLFVRILPPAEGGRAAEVYFSEKADAGDPRFIDKVAPTKLWVQAEPGSFRPVEVIKGADRLRAHVPVAGSVAVIGELDYGVLARPAQTPFLLRHYPKAVAGKPDELNGLRRREETQLEIMPQFASDHVLLTALRDGEPLAGAKIQTVDVNLVGDELTADAQGQVKYAPPATGLYSVYTQFVDKTPGNHDGHAYDEVREFATLAFNWPLARTDADPAAVKRFEDAVAARAKWQNFPGFTASVEGDVDGRSLSGDVTVSADGTVAVAAGDEPVADWVREQLQSIAMHRIASGASGDAHPIVRFADEDEDHPLGRLLEFEGGQFASSYRVKDNQLTVVNRSFGEQDMTITVLDNDRNPEGGYLSRNYTVQYWDAATGRLDRTESVQDRWARVGKLDLPLSHTVTTAAAGGLSVRSFTLSGHKLLDAK
jgi:Protein of unknown function (DUF3386)